MSVIRTTHESYTSQPAEVQIDTAKGEAYNVKILGWHSRNEGGREYDASGCSTAESLACFEGAICNIDHSDKGQTFAGRFGRFHEPYATDDGIYAKRFKYNTAHPLAKTFEQWCLTDPAAVGFSQVALCRVNPKRKGKTVFEGIVKVDSVDLVANPATTKGVYESLDENLNAGGGDYQAQIGALVASIINDPSLDKAAKRKKINAALKLVDDGESDVETPAETKETESLRTENAALKAELNVIKVKESANARLATIKTLCNTAGLPAAVVTESFVANLATIPDDAGVQRVIETCRDALRSDVTPISAGQGGKPTLDYNSFVKQAKTGKA